MQITIKSNTIDKILEAVRPHMSNVPMWAQGPGNVANAAFHSTNEFKYFGVTSTDYCANVVFTIDDKIIIATVTYYAKLYVLAKPIWSAVLALCDTLSDDAQRLAEMMWKRNDE